MALTRTIKEAWAGLPKGAELNARALALAVLGEAWNKLVEGSFAQEHDAAYRELRADIDALGADDS